MTCFCSKKHPHLPSKFCEPNPFFKYLKIDLSYNQIKQIAPLLLFAFFVGSVNSGQRMTMTIHINKLVGIRPLREEGKILTTCVALNIEKIVCDELPIQTESCFCDCFHFCQFSLFLVFVHYQPRMLKIIL
jgi:hypothetical protein